MWLGPEKGSRFVGNIVGKRNLTKTNSKNILWKPEPGCMTGKDLKMPLQIAESGSGVGSFAKSS